jgi:hypothetical protein
MWNTDRGQNQGSEWRYGIISVQTFMMGNGYFSTYLPVESSCCLQKLALLCRPFWGWRCEMILRIGFEEVGEEKWVFFLDDVILVVALVSVLQEGENKSVKRNPPNRFCKPLRWDDTFFCEDNVPWSWVLLSLFLSSGRIPFSAD